MSNDFRAAGEPLVLPLASISVQEGFNRRRAFRPAAMDRLIESIRAQDVIQPILVRPRRDGADGFWIVAGERRFRACTALGKADIPALVKDLDDHEAQIVCLLENIDRADLTPAEEALAARDALDLNGGDKAGTASQLGWSATKLESRLLLLKATEPVLLAVADGSIGVGHAELLAGLPDEQQNKALGRIIADHVSVADLKDMVRGVVIPLASAVFDTSACATCPFNTAVQGSLFGDAVAGAHCKNRVCFTDKTNAALEAKRAALQEDVGTVALATEKDPGSYIPLVANGPTGVGEEQFAQCRGCVHFGALIQNKLDGRTGQVDRPMCFNLACHTTKVAANAEARAAAAEAARADEEPAATTTAAAAAKGGKVKPTKETAGKAKAKPAAPAASSQAARVAMKPAYAAAATKLLADDPRVPLALGIASLERLAHDAAINRKACAPAGKFEDVVAGLLSSDAATLAQRYREACAALMAGSLANPNVSRPDLYPAVVAARLAQSLDADLSAHFRVDDAYLAAHTREGIAAVLAESGFDAWLQKQPDGAKRAKALATSKKTDLIKAVMASGFDWQGFVPAAVKAVTPRSFVGV